MYVSCSVRATSEGWLRCRKQPGYVDWFSSISVPSRSISSTSPSYSAFEPSHHTVRSGRVRLAASSTHFSTTLVTAMSVSFPLGLAASPSSFSSVRHEYRHGDLAEDVPRGPAQDEF